MSCSSNTDGEHERVRAELRALSAFVLRGMDDTMTTDMETTWVEKTTSLTHKHTQSQNKRGAKTNHVFFVFFLCVVTS
jgi:hypothetical protein